MNQNIRINDQIELAEIRETDKAALTQHLNDKTIFANTLMIPYPYTEANAEWFINFAREEQEKHGYVVKFAIRKNGALVGGIGLMHNDKPTATHKAEIDYWLAQSLRNQGIMSAVLRGLVDYVFTKTPLVRIEATVFAPNVASQKALEKAGFVREGFAPKFHNKDGVPLDVFLFSKVK